MAIKHLKVSPKADSTDTSIIQPSDWNNNHGVDEVGVIFGELPNSGIRSIAAGQNYFNVLQRKFNGEVKEEYEFFEPPDLISTNYDFPGQIPIYSLIALELTTVTLNPVPLGINGSNLEHYVYIYDPSGGSEAVKIEGGSAVSGSSSGTIFIRPTKNHALGAYEIRSATAGIQEAINALPSTGGKIKVPKGQYEIFATITLNKTNTKITGAGLYSTEIRSSYNNGPLFFINSAGNYIEYLCLKGVGLTNHYGIVIGNSTRSWIRYINISECPGGIQVQNINESDVNTIESCWVSFYTRCGVEILGSNSVILLNVYCVSGSGAEGYGFHIKKTGGLQMINCHSFANNVGMVIFPDGGNPAAHIFMTNCIFDFSVEECLRIACNGGTISGVFIVNCYFSYSKKGISIINPTAGLIEYVEIVGSRVGLNKEQGILIIGSNIFNIAVDDCVLFSNSGAVGGDGLHDGIQVVSNGTIDGLFIRNNVIDVQSAHPFNMRSGINLGYPDSTNPLTNVLVTGNRIGEKVTTINGEKAYIFGLNNSPISTAIIKDNLPVSAKNFTMTIPGAAIAFLGNSTYEIFIATGTQAINQMYPHWAGREITIVKTDSGTWTFNNTDSGVHGFRTVNHVLAQNECIQLKYDGAKWNVIK